MYHLIKFPKWDYSTEKWSRFILVLLKGPPLLTGRYDHSCGTFKFNEKTMVIVSGGTVNHRPSTSTEIWDPTSEAGWEKGKKMRNFKTNVIC